MVSFQSVRLKQRTDDLSLLGQDGLRKALVGKGEHGPRQ